MVVVLTAGAVSQAFGQTTSGQTISLDRSFSPQFFHPAPGPDEFITLEPAAPLRHKEFGIGFFASYARNPLPIFNYDDTKKAVTGTRANIIGNLLGAELWAGIGIIDRLQIALSLPMTLYQNGQDFSSLDGTTTIKAPNGFALGDPRIYLKARLYGHDRGFQLALSHWLSVPVGDDSAFGGEKHFSGFMGEARALLGWEGERFRVGALVGFLWRAHDEVFLSTELHHQITYGAAGAFDVIPRRLTLVAELYGQHDFTSYYNSNPLEIDVAAKLKVIPPLSLNLGVGNGLVPGVGSPQPRVYFGVVYARDSRDRDHDGVPDSMDQCPDTPEDRDGFKDEDGCPDLDNDADTILDRDDKCPNEREDFDDFEDQDGCPDPDNDKDGIPDLQDHCPNDAEDGKPPFPHDGCPASKTDTDGDGIMDDKDKCPKDPEDKDGFQDDDGCPDPDNDGDGIPDEFDQCPNAPEDMDGYKDDDGCPDPDNDSDGIPDKQDKCPDQPETINGYQDEDGCPDQGPPPMVRLEKKQIVILDKIYFEKDKARILPKSFNLLDQVALLLKAHSDLKIRIEGHTDSQGKAEHNNKLSQDRADSVLLYLAKKGVDAGRLVSAGYGSAQPIADNKSAKGREANRRVEFHIMDDGPKEPANKPSEGETPGNGANDNKQ
jgi:outer membrane protein OmpA-like peptidoglycan-associated protein